MNLQNGYKVLIEKITDGERTFIAKGPEVEDKEFGPFAIGEFKLVYEKDGRIYGSTTGIPTEEDTCFDAFDAIFIADEDKDSEVETPEDPEDGTDSTTPEDPEDESTGATDPEDPENNPDDSGNNTEDDESNKAEDDTSEMSIAFNQTITIEPKSYIEPELVESYGISPYTISATDEWKEFFTGFSDDLEYQVIFNDNTDDQKEMIVEDEVDVWALRDWGSESSILYYRNLESGLIAFQLNGDDDSLKNGFTIKIVEKA